MKHTETLSLTELLYRFLITFKEHYTDAEFITTKKKQFK